MEGKGKVQKDKRKIEKLTSFLEKEQREGGRSKQEGRKEERERGREGGRTGKREKRKKERRKKERNGLWKM